MCFVFIFWNSNSFDFFFYIVYINIIQTPFDVIPLHLMQLNVFTILETPQHWFSAFVMFSFIWTKNIPFECYYPIKFIVRLYRWRTMTVHVISFSHRFNKYSSIEYMMLRSQSLRRIILSLTNDKLLCFWLFRWRPCESIDLIS